MPSMKGGGWACLDAAGDLKVSVAGYHCPWTLPANVLKIEGQTA